MQRHHLNSMIKHQKTLSPFESNTFCCRWCIFFAVETALSSLLGICLGNRPCWNRDCWVPKLVPWRPIQISTLNSIPNIDHYHSYRFINRKWICHCLGVHWSTSIGICLYIPISCRLHIHQLSSNKFKNTCTYLDQTSWARHGTGYHCCCFQLPLYGVAWPSSRVTPYHYFIQTNS